MFDLLFTQVNHKEIEFLLSDVKDNFIQSLFDLIREYENREIDNSDNQDIIIMVIKLLGRMGHIPRTMKYKTRIEFKEKLNMEYFCLLIHNNERDKRIKFNLCEAIDSIYSFIKNIIEKRQNIPKIAYIDNAYKFLKNSLIRIFNFNNTDPTTLPKHSKINISKEKSFKSGLIQELSSLKIEEELEETKDFHIDEHQGKSIIEKIVYCLINFLVLSNIYSNNCKTEIEETFSVLSKVLVTNYILLSKQQKPFPPTNKSHLLLKGIIENMSFRVLLVRGEPSYENLSEPFHFGIKLIESMIIYIKDLSQKYPDQTPETCFHSFAALVLEHILTLAHQKKLNKAFAGLLALERVLNLLPDILIQTFALQILSLIFSFLQGLTDIIDIENKMVCFTIGDRVLAVLVKSPQGSFSLKPLLRLFFNNLVSTKEMNNRAAIYFFTELAKGLRIPPTNLLYYSDGIIEENYEISEKYIRKQIDFSISELIEKYSHLFISQILKKCLQVLEIPSLNEDELERFKAMEDEKLKLFASALKTLEFLMSLKVIPFRIIQTLQEEMKEDLVDDKLCFDPDFDRLMGMNWKLLLINEKLFRNASDIIIPNMPNPMQMQGIYQPPANLNMGNVSNERQEFQPQSFSKINKVF